MKAIVVIVFEILATLNRVLFFIGLSVSRLAKPKLTTLVI